jgi:uncharacterized protein YecT (DUF1311 family)
MPRTIRKTLPSLVLLLACLYCRQISFAQFNKAADSPCREAKSDEAATTCFDDAYKKARNELTHTVDHIEGTISGTSLEKLERAQKLWIMYKNATCDAQSELYSGSSNVPVIRLACLEALTRHRIDELNAIYGSRLNK